MSRMLCITALVLLLAPAIHSNAQEHPMLGAYNSPKGFGVSYFMNDRSDKGFSKLTLFMDIYGITTGRCTEPGFRFNYSREFEFFHTEVPGAQLSVYAGPGATLGFVKDYEPGFALSITRNHGICAAVSGDIGIRAYFPRGIAVDFSFMAEFGAHFRRGEDVVHNRFLSLFKNGLAEAYWPALSIMFTL